MIANDASSSDSADFGSDFFVDGGTLRHDAPSYVKRPADDELYQSVQEGNFCYVLTPRQMGKSSLMVHTAHRLREEGVQSAIVDLTRIGTDLKAEQWYLGLMRSLRKQLDLETDPQPWWRQHEQLGAVQRFTRFLREVVLVETSGQVVIFIDEIDSTLKLDFSDDFFAAIRYIYNARATDKTYERLTFVLLGVATPTDLIKNRRRTPFNIGQRIDLNEFSRQDAHKLQQGLQAIYPDQGKAIFDRIFSWTSGHPYLTQKLCLTVGESNRSEWDDASVDALVHELYLSRAARRETNLQFVRENVAASSDRRQLLTLYQRVYEGKTPVPEDERSHAQNRLKLYGLIKAADGRLVVRNAIYRQAFDETWIKENMPPLLARSVIITAVLIAVLMVAGIGYAIFNQEDLTTAAVADQAISDFENNTDPAIRLNALSRLFGLEGYAGRARELFYALEPEEQMALFGEGTRGPQTQIRAVITGTYVLIDDQDNREELLRQMRDAVDDSEGEDSQFLKNELNSWLDGLTADDYQYAALKFQDAADFSKGQNPAVQFQQAVAYLQQSAYEQALLSFNRTIEASVDDDVLDYWQDRVMTTIINDAQLHAVWWETSQAYQALAAVVPEPTATLPPAATPETGIVEEISETPTVTPTTQAIELESGEGSVTTAVFSPDKSRVLVTYDNGLIRLWDGTSGRQVAVLGGDGDLLTPVFSPEGDYVITAGRDDKVRLWEAESGEEFIELTGHEGWVVGAAFSPDGERVLTGSIDGTARLWDVSSGEELTVLSHADNVGDVYFSPDGQRILTDDFSTYEVRLWQGGSSGTLLAEIPYGFHGEVESVLFSPNGERVLITTHQFGPFLLNAINGESISISSELYEAVFSPDGEQVIALDFDDNVQLFDGTNGEQIETFALDENVFDATISPDGSRIISFGSDGTARLWDALSGEELIELAEYDIPRPTWFRAFFSADGSRIFITNSDGAAEVRDAASGMLLFVIPEQVTSTVFSADGSRIFIANSNGMEEVRDATSGELLASLSRQPASVDIMSDFSIGSTILDVAFRPDSSELASGDTNGNLGVWSLAETAFTSSTAIGDWVQGVAYSPDGQFLAAAANDGNIYILDPEAEPTIAIGAIAAHDGIVFDVAFSPDSRFLASAGGDGQARVWQFPDLQQVSELVLAENAVYDLAFSPDSTRLATAVVGEVNGRIQVWNMSTGQEICRSPAASMLSVALSPDGEYMASGNTTGDVTIYDAASCTQLQLLHAHQDNVNGVAYSPDGQWLLSGSRSGEVKLWSLDGATVAEDPVVLNVHSGSVETVAFGPDGRTFATAGEGGQIILWTLSETESTPIPTPTPTPTPAPLPTPTPTPPSFVGSLNLLSQAASATWVNNIGADNVWLDYYPTEVTDPNAAPGFAAFANANQQLETGEAVGSRTILATHPPFVQNGEIRGIYQLTLPAQGADFSASLAFLAGADQEQGTNGVVVQIWWQNLAANVEPVQLSSDTILYTGMQKNIVADLGDFGGQTGELILVIQARGLPGRDWITWTSIRLNGN